MPRRDPTRWRKDPRTRIGKPTKLTAAVQRAIIMALLDDAYLKHAAEAAGVSDDAVREWIARGNATGDEPYASFARAVERAQARAVVKSMEIISKAAADGDWKAAAWKLEKKHPKLFGALVKLEHDAGPSLQELLARALPTLQQFYGTAAAADAAPGDKAGTDDDEPA